MARRTDDERWWLLDHARDVPCPACRSGFGEACMSRSGYPTAIHEARKVAALTSRRPAARPSEQSRDGAAAT